MPLEFEKSDSTIGAIAILEDTNTTVSQESIADGVCHRDELGRTCRELSAAAQRRRRSYLRWHAGLTALALCLTAIIVVMLALSPQQPGAVTTTACCGLLAWLTTCLIGVGGYLRLTRRSKTLRNLMETVIAADNTAATGALIDMLGVDDTLAARGARRQLARLAPRWTEADFAVLTPEQRTGLRRIIDGIQSGRHGDPLGTATGRRYLTERIELRMAICSAVGRLGNDEDLRVLRRLSHIPCVTSSARQVRDAAASAFRELDARLAKQNRPHTLLRASKAPPSNQKELVRAAGTPDVTPPKQLLRPD